MRRVRGLLVSASAIGPEGRTECPVGSTRITDAGACQTAATAVKLLLVMVNEEGDEGRCMLRHFLVAAGALAP